MDSLRRHIALLLVALAVANGYAQSSPLDDWPTWRARVIALVNIITTNNAVSLDRFIRQFTKWADAEPGHIRQMTWAEAEDTNTTWLAMEWTNQVITLSIPEYVP